MTSAGSCGPGSRGSSTVTVVPASAADSIETVPPCWVTIECTMLSPRPDPWMARAVAADVRKKRVNKCSWSSAEMPIPVSATSDSEDTRHRHDLEMSTYEGPTGIVGVLADAATQVGVPSVSCWAAVPHYAGHSPSPKATLALVSRLEDLLDGPIEHGELDEDSHAWERGINELAASDTEVAEYVESLEEAQDTADLPEASGDAIAKEFERYLRRRGTDDS